MAANKINKTKIVVAKLLPDLIDPESDALGSGVAI